MTTALSQKDVQGLPKLAANRIVEVVNAALAAAGGDFDGSSLFSSATDLDGAVQALAKGVGVKGLVAVHKVRGLITANIADLAAFTVAGNDGLTYAEGERVYLNGQSTGAEKGPYVVGVVASGTAPLTRAGDWAAAAVIPSGTLVVVDAGTSNGNSLWMINNAGDVTVATTTPVLEEIASKARLLALLALTTTGNGASLLGIEDAGGYITAANAEAAFAEIARVGQGLTEVVSADGAVSVVKEHTNLSIDGTKAYTLAAGAKIGQRKVIACTSATNTPAGTITGTFVAAGVAKTTAAFDATTDFLMLSWTGAAWNVEYNVGVTMG